MKIVKIQLQHIDLTDHSYTFRPDTDNLLPADLERSFRQFGILHPPILKEKQSGFYTPVAGRKRLLFLKESLRVQGCQCLILPHTLDDLSTWQLALEERLQKGPLTPVEMALFFQKVLRTSSIEQAAEIFLPLMGQPPQAFTLKKILPLADLEEPIQQALHIGELDLKVALTLCEYSFRDRLALFDMIDSLNLSIGYQKKFISICKELERRTDESILSILSQPGIKAILDSDANLPQKATNLMKYLTDLASPKLTGAKNEFNKFLKGLDLPKNISLTHSQSFETDTLSLSLTFKNRNTFLNFWDNHKKLCQKS